MSHGGTLIYETVHGSHAYGLAGSESDVDVKGVIVGPRTWYHGFRGTPEQVELSKDHVRYEIRKFFRLATAANPTLLELLWTDPSHHRVVTPAGEMLLKARARFLSRRVRETFVGYALSQLRRIRGHRGWLLTPPAREPRRSDYGLPETSVIARDQLRAAEVLIEQGRIEEAELTPNFIEIMQREGAYRQARRNWEGYVVWRKTRNPKRAELEARFGYDTKHALHLIRMLRMGAEILRDGTVRVHRVDAEELLAIRAGAWSYDELVERAEALGAAVEAAASGTALPEAPDEAALDALCAEIVEQVLA